MMKNVSITSLVCVIIIVIFSATCVAQIATADYRIDRFQHILGSRWIHYWPDCRSYNWAANGTVCNWFPKDDAQVQ